MTIESIEDEAAGVDRTTKKMIAWHLDGIEGVGRFQDARVVMRIVAVKAEPVPKAQLAREIDAAGASEIRIEVRAGALRAGGSGCGIESKADNRSEEHTSELQSRFDIVCRLLLEKKKI